MNDVLGGGGTIADTSAPSIGFYKQFQLYETVSLGQIKQMSGFTQIVDELKQIGFFLNNVDAIFESDGALFNKLIDLAKKNNTQQKISIMNSIYWLYNVYLFLMNSLHASFLYAILRRINDESKISQPNLDNTNMIKPNTILKKNLFLDSALEDSDLLILGFDVQQHDEDKQDVQQKQNVMKFVLLYNYYMFQGYSSERISYVYNLQQIQQQNTRKEFTKKQQLKAINSLIQYYYRTNHFIFNEQLLTQYVQIDKQIIINELVDVLHTLLNNSDFVLSKLISPITTSLLNLLNKPIDIATNQIPIINEYNKMFMQYLDQNFNNFFLNNRI